MDDKRRQELAERRRRLQEEEEKLAKLKAENAERRSSARSRLPGVGDSGRDRLSSATATTPGSPSPSSSSSTNSSGRDRLSVGVTPSSPSSPGLTNSGRDRLTPLSPAGASSSSLSVSSLAVRGNSRDGRGASREYRGESSNGSESPMASSHRNVDEAEAKRLALQQKLEEMKMEKEKLRAEKERERAERLAKLEAEKAALMARRAAMSNRVDSGRSRVAEVALAQEKDREAREKEAKDREAREKEEKDRKDREERDRRASARARELESERQREREQKLREEKEENERLERERLDELERKKKEAEDEEEKRRQELDQARQERARIRAERERQEEERERERQEVARKRREEEAAELERRKQERAARYAREEEERKKNAEERRQREEDELKRQRDLRNRSRDAQRKEEEELDRLRAERQKRRLERLERLGGDEVTASPRASTDKPLTSADKRDQELHEIEQLRKQLESLKQRNQEEEDKVRRKEMDLEEARQRRREEQEKRRAEEEARQAAEAQEKAAAAKVVEEEEEDEDIRKLKEELERIEREEREVKEREEREEREAKEREAKDKENPVVPKPKRPGHARTRSTTVSADTAHERSRNASARGMINPIAASPLISGRGPRRASQRGWDVANSPRVSAERRSATVTEPDEKAKPSASASARVRSSTLASTSSIPVNGSPSGSSPKSTHRESKNPVLIQVKGVHKIHARKVESSWKSLNKSDVFILDAGETIFQWNGEFAHRSKRAKGVDIANDISKQQRHGTAEVVIIEDGGIVETPKEFWEKLGSEPQGIIPKQGTDDHKAEKEWTSSDKLLRVNPGGEFFPIEGKLKRTKLASNFCYVLDCDTEVYVWCGKETDAKRKEEAVKAGKKLFVRKPRAAWSVMRKVAEDVEPVLFKEKFVRWGRKHADSDPRVKSSTPTAIRRATVAVPAAWGIAEPCSEDILREYDRTYTYTQLLEGDYPASVDSSKKESYLSDEEFHQVFNMTKEQFYKQPAWKIKSLKLSTNLF